VRPSIYSRGSIHLTGSGPFITLNIGAKHLDELITRTDVVPAVNQVELHPFFIQRKLGGAHAGLGVATQSWSPLGGVKVYAAA
jgi:diketogulonate reductase-like aldo/keto reductase